MSNHGVRVLALVGSLRQGSYNRALLRAAVEVKPAEMEVTEFDLRPVPFFNGDVEAQGDPPPVQELKEAVRAADGLLIVSPEYHRSIPAVLKNAVDWAGRDPKGKGVITSSLSGKPVGLLGTGGAYGTLHAQMHLRQVLAETRSHVMTHPQVYVTFARQKFDANFKLADDPTRQQLTDFMKALAEWTGRMKT
jgi:chromate reductase